MEHNSFLLDVTERLAELLPAERKGLPGGTAPMPSLEVLREIMALFKAVVFPDFFDRRTPNQRLRACYIGANLDRLYRRLHEQLARTLLFTGDAADDDTAVEKARTLASEFVLTIPKIKHLLFTDVEAVVCNDPAVSSYGEVIYCYPVLQAMTCYRAAHELKALGVPVVPRIITELAHSATGIDINPGAEIGEYFSIDHGTGVVIGETAVIGNHVSLYQGVTLGAKNFTYDADGHPINLPRHPILEDNVTVYSNSSILGRITVGHDSVIGGNVWLTESVPPHSLITQQRPAN